jgi:predicted MFS family arabinose efflux permease
MIGSFMALWIIFYGFVQAWAPSLFKNMSDTAVIQQALYWICVLILVPLLLALALWILDPFPNQILIITVIIGLLIFGGVFAINSSLHSFLILHFTSTERASLEVGFYYMSNAAGRLVGTVLSGVLFQFYGLAACLLMSTLLIMMATFISLELPVLAGRP